MKKLHWMVLGLTLNAGAVLSAQTAATDAPPGPRRGGPGGGPGPHWRGGHPVVRILDRDRDGVLSPAEIAGASAQIVTLDRNGDGTVSIEELRPARPPGAPTPPADATQRDDRRPERPVHPVMLALDANEDGTLSAAEIDRAPASLNALDANGDGTLTLDELRPLPPEGAPAGSGGPHRNGPRPSRE